MTAGSDKAKPSWSRRSVPTPVIVLTAIVVTVLVVLYGINSLSVQDRDKSPLERQVDARIIQLAHQSGGSLDKLSAEDRHWLQNVTQGHGEFAMKFTGHER